MRDILGTVIKHIIGARTQRPQRYRVLKKGFTLIELLVVIAIGLLLTSMAVSQYFPYVDKINYENTVLDIALRMREYQTYGVSTKQDTNQSFKIPYGFHTKVGDSVFTFFQDNNPTNKKYDGSSCAVGGECVTQVAMTGYKVSSLTVTQQIPTSGAQSLYSFNSSSNATLDVTFLRPYLESNIYVNGLTAGQYREANINICIADSLAATPNPLKISITQTGQISISPVSSGTDITQTCV